MRKNIFSAKSMITMVHNLDLFNKDRESSTIKVDGMIITARRLYEISLGCEEKLNRVLSRMDFKPPFDIERAKQRLDNGYYFIVAEIDNKEIIGWSWAAVKKVFYDEFCCTIDIKGKQGFSFNTFIDRGWRGKQISQILLNEELYQLKKDGFDKVWALIYPWNRASLRAYEKNGWKEAGRYRFFRILFVNIKIPPRSIQDNIVQKNQLHVV